MSKNGWAAVYWPVILPTSAVDKNKSPLFWKNGVSAGRTTEVNLSVCGASFCSNAALAWAYVGFRVLHSLVQATWNRVAVRFLLFLLSSLALVALTLHALIALFAIH